VNRLWIVAVFCTSALAQQVTREHPCPDGRRMEGDYERDYACVPNSETAKATVNPLKTTAPTVNKLQSATWESDFGFEDELYPSFILTMGGRAIKNPDPVHFFGDPLGHARVTIHPTIPSAKVHVEIQVEGFTSVSSLDTVLGDAGQTYVVAPVLRWNYSRLQSVDQSIPATVTFKVSVNGLVGQETRPVRVRSVNDVPFYAITPDGKQTDLSFLFAGFVNESHPFVQTLLQEALQYKAVDSFVGYQSGSDAVRMQVFALWNVLQRRGVHYSSITTASAASTTGHVQSQAVRFIDQSIATQQANCVDGSVLFASLMYKIGIMPVLVVKPGHMFVGYYLDKDRKQFEFLETTKLGSGPQPGLLKDVAFSPILHPVAGSASFREFIDAVNFATNVYSKEVAPAVEAHKPHYLVIDVAKAREVGINAIPHKAN